MADNSGTATAGLIQGIGGYISSRKSADIILANAGREAKRIRLMGKKKVESDKAAVAGSGLTMDSFAEVLEESIANTEYNARTVLLQARQKAKKIKQAGTLGLITSAAAFGMPAMNQATAAGSLFNFGTDGDTENKTFTYGGKDNG